MWLAPDCRIYIEPKAANFNVHIIEHPNRGGHEAGLVVNAVDSPTRFTSDGFISFPNYRAVSGCDSTIAPIEGAISNNTGPIVTKKGLSIYPNPAQNFVTIGKLSPNAEVSLVGVSGERFINLAPSLDVERTLDIRKVPSGAYFVVVHDLVSKIETSLKLVIGPN